MEGHKVETVHEAVAIAVTRVLREISSHHLLGALAVRGAALKVTGRASMANEVGLEPVLLVELERSTGRAIRVTTGADITGVASIAAAGLQ